MLGNFILPFFFPLIITILNFYLFFFYWISSEWISPATVSYVANYLLTNPNASSYLSQYTFTFIPVVNVDGYAYTRDPNGDRMWRKNRQPNKGSNCVGTDPNRNWDFAWSKPGASNSPCNDAYYGPAPFSAPESKAVADYIKKLGNVISYVDFHSYSELWMFPWVFYSDLVF